MYRGVWCEYARRREAGQDVSDAADRLPRVSLVSASNKLKAEMTGLVAHASGGGRGGGEGGAGTTDPPGGSPPPAQGSKAAYKARKHDAIALTSTLLDRWCAADASAYALWRTHFQSSCKKEQDDLSDCLLQGLYVLRKPLVAAQTKAVKRAVAQAKRASKAASKAATKAGKTAGKPIAVAAT